MGIARSPRYSAVRHICGSGNSTCFSGNHGFPLLQPPTPACHYAAKMHPPALWLELGHFQVAYGAPTAMAHASETVRSVGDDEEDHDTNSASCRASAGFALCHRPPITLRPNAFSGGSFSMLDSAESP